jgi:hypothetical protein
MLDDEQKRLQVEILVKALKEVFGEEPSESTRFVDVSRIPLLCASVIQINKTMSELSQKIDDKYVTKESFEPVKTLVFGLVGLILTSVVLALLALVIINR